MNPLDYRQTAALESLTEAHRLLARSVEIISLKVAAAVDSYLNTLKKYEDTLNDMKEKMDAESATAAADADTRERTRTDGNRAPAPEAPLGPSFLGSTLGRPSTSRRGRR